MQSSKWSRYAKYKYKKASFELLRKILSLTFPKTHNQTTINNDATIYLEQYFAHRSRKKKQAINEVLG